MKIAALSTLSLELAKLDRLVSTSRQKVFSTALRACRVAKLLQVRRADTKNCYVRIPHNLKGEVADHVVERLSKFYRETFWSNVAAFKCCQAAQAAAEHACENEHFSWEYKLVLSAQCAC